MKTQRDDKTVLTNKFVITYKRNDSGENTVKKRRAPLARSQLSNAQQRELLVSTFKQQISKQRIIIPVCLLITSKSIREMFGKGEFLEYNAIASFLFVFPSFFDYPCCSYSSSDEFLPRVDYHSNVSIQRRIERD